MRIGSPRTRVGRGWGVSRYQTPWEIAYTAGLQGASFWETECKFLGDSGVGCKFLGDGMQVFGRRNASFWETRGVGCKFLGDGMQVFGRRNASIWETKCKYLGDEFEVK
jgi:hypothetical protein